MRDRLAGEKKRETELTKRVAERKGLSPSLLLSAVFRYLNPRERLWGFRPRTTASPHPPSRSEISRARDSRRGEAALLCLAVRTRGRNAARRKRGARKDRKRVRSELFERDVYSCQDETERRSTQQTLQAARRRGKRRRRQSKGVTEVEKSEGEKLRRKRGSPVCTS